MILATIDGCNLHEVRIAGSRYRRWADFYFRPFVTVTPCAPPSESFVLMRPSDQTRAAIDAAIMIETAAGNVAGREWAANSTESTQAGRS